jgi:hypothetical protein
MNTPTCSLWILVARTDVSFMRHTIPHLIKMSNFPFTERVLVIDTVPLSAEKARRPNIGTLEELRNCAQSLINAGIIDRFVDINYDSSYQNQVYLKHFGYKFKSTHGNVGCPILPYLFGIEEAHSEYLLHFDSDMLLYQTSKFNWIKEAITLMEKFPEIITARPLTGPPHPDGYLYQPGAYETDPNGFYKFKGFSARTYLIKRSRFEDFLPIPLIWSPYRYKLFNKLPISWKATLNYLTGKGKVIPWETMVSKKLEQSDYFRAVLSNQQAWTLHPKDRSPAFINALPDIIRRIEAGDYPEGQAGHYDLIPELWY